MNLNLLSSPRELIRERKSTRTYSPRPLEPEKKELLERFLEEQTVRSGLRGRFVLLDTLGEGKQKMGTYGFITGATTYVAGILHQEETDAVRFGEVFETIILYATSLGLQTCWLGGTFQREAFARSLKLEEGERLPVISPVGYGQESPRLGETILRSAIGANGRKSWDKLFFHESEEVSLTKGEAGAYAEVLEMVRLCPSASNKQPWRVVMDHDCFRFYLARTPGYGVTGFDLQKNDLGIAKCHFELAARDLGLKGEWLVEAQAPAGPGEYLFTWRMNA